MSIFSRIFSLFALAILFNSMAQAQLGPQTSNLVPRSVFISPPEKILEKAQGARYHYTDAISEIRNGELELAPVEEIYSYIMILDSLQAIEKRLEFPIWGVSPVKELGAYLTKIVSRRIDLFTIEDEVLSTILRWSQDENTFTILEYQTYKFAEQDFPQAICKAAFEHATLMLDIEASMKAPLMLIGAIENFQRTVFIRLLKTYKLNISVEELNALLKDLRSVDALMDSLKYFLYEAYDLKDPQDYVRIFNYVLAVAKINAQNFPQPLYDFDNTYGEIISTMIVKMLESGLFLDNVSFTDYKGLLKTKDIESIATHLLNYPVNQYKILQLPFVADLAKMAIEYNLRVNRSVEAKNLRLVYHEILVGLEIQKKNMEGFYEADMNGMKATITVFQSNSTSLAANISMNDGYSVDNFAFSRFNPDTNEVEFSKLERDMNGQSIGDDLHNKLSLKFDGIKIVGTYGNTENIYKITGNRLITFETPETQPLLLSQLPGRYKSQIGDYKVQLNIKEQKSGVYTASLNFNIEGVFTPILAATFEEFIFIKTKNLAYFTDLRVADDEKIKQLRIFINTEGKLTAQYILSGSKEVKTLSLHKW